MIANDACVKLPVIVGGFSDRAVQHRQKTIQGYPVVPIASLASVGVDLLAVRMCIAIAALTLSGVAAQAQTLRSVAPDTGIRSAITGLVARANPRTAGDVHCSDDPDDDYPDRDRGFTPQCKDDGGTMSGTQGRGGKTCFRPGP